MSNITYLNANKDERNDANNEGIDTDQRGNAGVIADLTILLEKAKAGEISAVLGAVICSGAEGDSDGRKYIFHHSGKFRVFEASGMLHHFAASLVTASFDDCVSFNV